MKLCAGCPSPERCTAAGKCLKTAKKAYGGMAKKAKKAKMNKGGVVKANCGASMKPQQGK